MASFLDILLALTVASVVRLSGAATTTTTTTTTTTAGATTTTTTTTTAGTGTTSVSTIEVSFTPASTTLSFSPFVSPTTTTEMPWGLPWWGWLFIILGLLLLCGAIGGLLAGMAAGGRKKTPKSPAVETYTDYEVVDVPDEAGRDMERASMATGYGPSMYDTTPGPY
mmetsp:Transcript_55981/g.103550  ORF Transcript_55981/g.103550 Transcript_55981/m.103550 type:complete len:167 (-) Transcript_55981:174-674(-)